jgi:hypothetical protein
MVHPRNLRNFLGYRFGFREHFTHKIKQTPLPLVRKRAIPTERPPLVDEI